MPRYMSLDTETSGLFDFRQPADAPGQPRLACFTALATDDALEVDEDHCFRALVKPDGWIITPEVSAINGLTTEQCEREGLPIEFVLNIYSEMIRDGWIVVAFNAQYDTKIMRGELRRAEMDDLFERTPNICAMRACGPLNIPKAGAKKGGFPNGPSRCARLSDAYRHFTGEELPDAHTSDGDARACLAVFRKLVEMGAAPEPQVHYAKNRPE